MKKISLLLTMFMIFSFSYAYADEKEFFQESMRTILETGGKVKNISIKSSLAKEETGYSIATKFELVVPALDNYTYTLFIMYSNPEKNYPLSITVGSAMEDDLENFNPNYECKNKEEFIDALRAILSSEAVKEVVKTLYTKASF